MQNIGKYALAALALALSVTACSGGKSSSQASTAAPAASAAPASDGAKVFQTQCSSCHGATGQGSPGAFPPLAGNAVVTGDAAKVIHIVKFGLSGKIEIAGQSYNGTMPNWGQSLSNADIAAAITYIRSSWGNKASAISEADVATAKK
jgi:cbb3-type cytochrome c oxidase subunit III